MTPIPNEQLPRGDRDEELPLGVSRSLANSIEALTLAVKVQNKRVPATREVLELADEVTKLLRENLQGRLPLTAVQVHELIEAQGRRIRELTAGGDRAAARIRELTVAHEAAERRAVDLEQRLERERDWFRVNRVDLKTAPVTATPVTA